MTASSLDDIILPSSGNACRVRVHVIPGSPASSIEEVYGDRLKVRIKAPPEKGKANRELIRFLASILQLKRNQITIVAGERGKDKMVQIADCPPEEVRQRLKKAGR